MMKYQVKYIQGNCHEKRGFMGLRLVAGVGDGNSLCGLFMYGIIMEDEDVLEDIVWRE